MIAITPELIADYEARWPGVDRVFRSVARRRGRWIPGDSLRVDEIVEWRVRFCPLTITVFDECRSIVLTVQIQMAAQMLGISYELAYLIADASDEPAQTAEKSVMRELLLWHAGPR